MHANTAQVTDSRPAAALALGRRGVRRFALKVADRFWTRFAGLMLRRPPQAQEGLLLTGCASIHTLFMRYRLDLAWLDDRGRVLACVPALKPWRASAGPRGTAHVLELAAGGLDALGIEAGSRIEHPVLQGRDEA